MRPSKQASSFATLDDRAAKLAVAKAELERAQVGAKATNELRIEYADKASEVARDLKALQRVERQIRPQYLAIAARRRTSDR